MLNEVYMSVSDSIAITIAGCLQWCLHPRLSGTRSNSLVYNGGMTIIRMVGEKKGLKNAEYRRRNTIRYQRNM